MKRIASHPLLCGFLLLIAFGSTTPGQEKKGNPPKEVLVVKTGTWGVWAAALSLDGKRIVTGHYGGYSPNAEVLVWEANTGRQLLSIPKAHTNTYSSAVAFSPDGKRILSGGHDNLVKVWDAETGKELLTLKGHSDWVTSAVWSPDGKRIVSGSGVPRSGTDPRGEVKVWDVETGREVFDLEGHAKGVWDVAVSADGKRIASSGRDKTVKVWDVRTGKEVLTLKGQTGVAAIAFSPDDKRLAGVSTTRKQKGDESWVTTVWEVETGKELLTIEGQPKEILGAVAFSRDGKWITAGGGVWTVKPNVMTGFLGLVKVWDAATGREVATFKVGSTVSSNVVGIAFTPDGNRIVAACASGTVHVWALEKQNDKP